MAFKFCKRCGNKLELEDESCDKCGAEQKKKTVAIGVTGTATEETETEETPKDRQQKTNETETNLPQKPGQVGFGIRPSILIAMALVVLLAVAS